MLRPDVRGRHRFQLGGQVGAAIKGYGEISKCFSSYEGAIAGEQRRLTPLVSKGPSRGTWEPTSPGWLATDLAASSFIVALILLMLF